MDSGARQNLSDTDTVIELRDLHKAYDNLEVIKGVSISAKRSDVVSLAWSAYTNKAIFLFHATTLVFFTGFPAWQQRGDALYYANYFADKTFNPLVPYPMLAAFFIILTLIVISGFGFVNRSLNRHLPQKRRSKLKLRANIIR